MQDTLSQEASRDLSSERAEPPGSVPGYNLLRRIGRGAFGEVWLADQANTGKRVAVKLYTRRRRPDWPLLAREVEKLAALDSTRNVVNLLEVGWDHDPPYFVMEHLEGGSLADRLDESGPLHSDDAGRIAIGIARGLVRAHGAGILHCDLKPANVLIDSEDEPRLCDFGQSRLATEQDPSLGTLFYMAPEQALAGVEGASDEVIQPNVRWDVYALGAVLFHMLTGQPPHRGEEFDTTLKQSDLPTRLTTYARRVTEAPVPELRGVDKELATIVRDCLRPAPHERTRNAQVVLSKLEDRAHRRQRRPVVIAGFALPILFGLALLFSAWRVVPETVETTESSLIAQKLVGDAVSARLLAAGLQQDIETRLSELIDLAESDGLREAIRDADGKPWEERNALKKLLDEWTEKYRQRSLAAGKTPDQSWFVIDAEGYALDRNPYAGGATIDDRFAHRDYYHGRGVEYQREKLPDDLTLRAEPGVSLPFRSQATKQFMLALAVPIRDASGDPVGMITRTIHVDDLLADWEKQVGVDRDATNDDRSDRQLALVDLRENLLLDHAWLETNQAKALDESTLRSTLRLDDDLYVALTADQPITSSASYRDPVAQHEPSLGGTWLAAFAPVGDTGWTAIVQERRTEAIAPVEELWTIFVRWGVLLASVFVGLLLLFWYLLSRKVRRG